MRFDDADDDVHALALEAMGVLEHLVGLADAGREAEVYPEPAALLLANEVEEMLRIAAGRVSGQGRSP